MMKPVKNSHNIR